MSTCIHCGNKIEFRRIKGKIIPLHTGCTKNDAKRLLKKSNFTRVTKCSYCSAEIFFVRHNGGSAFFDSLGHPWPKHPCYDKENQLPEVISLNKKSAGKDYILASILRCQNVAGRTEIILDTGNEDKYEYIKVSPIQKEELEPGQAVMFSKKNNTFVFVNEQNTLFDRMKLQTRRIIELKEFNI